MYTGIAGALGAIAVQFVAPDSFAVGLSISLLIGIVIGGLASIPGAIFGALFIQFIPNIADQISKAAPWAIYGIFLIGFMFLMPMGINGAIRLGWARFTRIASHSPAKRRVIHRRHPETIMFVKNLLACASAALALALAAAPAAAQKKYDPGASDTEIKIGQTMPYSGPASAYGTIGKAEAAYFKMINEQGGINGRKINFISLDDAYSPPKTVEMVRRLVEQDEVLLVFQTLGTPSNTAIHKYMNAKKVPQLFVATGATKWNDPTGTSRGRWAGSRTTRPRRTIYAKHILKNKPNAKIAVLYQNDDYGKDYLKGLKDGLGDKAKTMIVAEVSYEVTDPTVDSQIVQLQGSGADVFVNITTPKFAAQAIRKAFDIGWKPVHYLNNVSALGRLGADAGRARQVGRPDLDRLRQGPDRPAVGERPGDARVDAPS